MDVDFSKKYSKQDIKDFLDYDDKQLKIAEERKYLNFEGNSMYGIYFFQFLKNSVKKLEEIHDKH